MSYVSLYRKWRPAGFEEVLGQVHVTETLTGALDDDRVSHAYLFSGPRGTGKTSTARILAKCLNCTEGPGPRPCGKCRSCTEIADGSSLDVFEMDAASHTSVDDVREIRERIPFASAGGGHKVYIIDEAHQLSNPAFNALLKMLEEPPSHVIFVLCTTEAHKLPSTVVSRCQRFEFRRIPAEAVAEHLGGIASEEGIEADPDALALVARHAKGSVRDALSLLDQAAGTAEGRVTREVIREILGEAPEDVLGDLISDVVADDLPGIFRRIEALSEQGWDPRQLLRQLLEEFRAVFLTARGADDLVDAADDHRRRLRELAERFSGAHLEWVLRVLGEAQADMRLTTHPRLTLEVALARASAVEAGGDQTLLARVERLERAIVDGVAQPAPSDRPAPAPGRAPSPSAEEPAAQEPAAEPAEPAAEPAPPERSPEAESEGASEAEEPPAAEASEEPRTEEPAPPAEPVSGDLEERWETLVEHVRSVKRTTHAIVREGWPVSLSDDALVVAFANSFHAEAIHKPLHAKILGEATEQIFGRRLQVSSEVREGERPKRGRSNPAPPADDGGPAATETDDAAESAEDDPDTGDDPVDLVVRDLGAEVVEEVEGERRS